jgi:serine-type D-Ala-D-Ala carboxypeptidase/endopeptidase (penicillin-binding protein 4)
MGRVFLAAILTLAAVAGCARPAAPGKSRSPKVVAEERLLAGRLREVLHRLDGTRAAVSARVVDPASGTELYEDRSDVAVIPASNLKLLVSAAVLDRFGPDHELETVLAIDGDDLWLIGSGDPAAGDPRIAEKRGEKVTSVLDRFADALAGSGLREVKGHLYYYDGAFDDVRVHPSWSRAFLTDWYAAPVAGLNFNDNCVDVTVRPAALGEPAAYEAVPPVRGIEIVNETISGGEGAAGISRARSSDVFTMSGGVKAEKKLESKPVTDPGAFFADALRANLSSHGIEVRGETRRGGRPPAGARAVTRHVTVLRDVLWRINKNSQNLFAEAMAKYLGRAYEIARGSADARGSWESGSLAVREFLRRQGVDASKFAIVDGSGLSRENRVTTRGQTQLLATMARHRYADVFRESLGVSGLDGTIARRMSDIAGRVRAKTGSIRGVRSLSGYVRTNQGRWLAFSIIYNEIPDGEPGPKAFEALADEACRLMAGLDR